jgi:hypothetical protein
MLKKILLLTAGLFVLIPAGQLRAETSSQALPETQMIKVQGQVSKLQDKAFILNHDQQRFRVDISELANSSLPQNLRQGDQVYVVGIAQQISDQQNPSIIAERITLLEVQRKSDVRMDPATGQPVEGELITKIQRNYMASDISENAQTLEGRILNIRGRDIMLQTNQGTVSVNTLDLGLDPTGAYVEPALERGDMVELLASKNMQTGRTNAERVLAVKKPWSSTVYKGQRLTSQGEKFLQAQMNSSKPRT